MSNTIALAVDLPASPARLYRMYLDPKQHAAFTGLPVTIAARVGAPFKALLGPSWPFALRVRLRRLKNGGAVFVTGRLLQGRSNGLSPDCWRLSGSRGKTTLLPWRGRARAGRPNGPAHQRTVAPFCRWCQIA